MKVFGGRHVGLRLLFVAAVAGICAAGVVANQDTSAKATFGEKELKAGFTPDPFTVEVVAGGEIKTDRGGVGAYVAKAPDFRVTYTAGTFPLTFRTESSEDTTLLINLPDGTWIADDDSGGNLNAKIHLTKPQSGNYEIWVGTLKEGSNPKAKLIITELK